MDPLMAEALAGLDRLPWDRMIHFFDRATAVPDDIRNVCAGTAREREAGFRALARNLEHQDGLTLATPYATVFLLRALPVATPDAQVVILDLLRIFTRAANFILASRGAFEVAADARSVPPAAELWPPFENAHQDAILWEQVGEEEATFVGWHAQTRARLLESRAALQGLRDEKNPAVARAAAVVLGLLDDRTF